MKKFLTGILVLCFGVIAPSDASAFLFSDFSFFGETSVNLATSAVVHEGFAGSNGTGTFGGSSRVNDGISVGGNMTTSTNTQVGTNTQDAFVITGGNLLLGNSADFFGNVDVGGNATKSGTPNVNGNLTAGGTIQAGINVTGTQTAGGSLVPHDPVVLPAATPFGGVSGAAVGNGASVGPGSYGNLTTSTGNSVTLNAPGTYYFDNVAFAANGELILDGTGDFNIFSNNNFNGGTGFDVTLLNGATAENVYVEAANNISISASSFLFGTYYAPNGTFLGSTSTQLTGAAYGQSVTGSASFDLNEFRLANYLQPTDNGGGGNNVVPEPATIVLFSSGMAGMFLRRRKKA